MSLDPLFNELEQNIADDLSMERLAEAGLLSRTQLYYEFYNVTGHTMGEYIRRRRLSNALALIKTSRLPLTDIACQCGFSSQQAMGRAVRQPRPSARKHNQESLIYIDRNRKVRLRHGQDRMDHLPCLQQQNAG